MFRAAKVGSQNERTKEDHPLVGHVRQPCTVMGDPAGDFDIEKGETGTGVSSCGAGGQRSSSICSGIPVLAILLSLSLLIVQDPKLDCLERILFLAQRSNTLSSVFRLTPPPRVPVLVEEPRSAALSEFAPSAALSAKELYTHPQSRLRTPTLSVGAARVPPPEATALGASDWLPVLHQTAKSLKLSPQQAQWRASWVRLGFRVRTADNMQARMDIIRMARMSSDARLLHVYDALETNVQRSDMWRYAILWLEGGIYADIDVYAHPPIVALARSSPGVIFTESLPIFDWLPRSLARWVGFFALHLGLTDLVRLPQRRNCIMFTPARHPLMLHTLQLIVNKFEAERHLAPQPEPTHTLELTGPGIFTDALYELIDGQGGGSVGKDALGLKLVSRFEGMQYFQHVAQGTWKTYLGDAQAHGLKPHERTLRWVVLLMQATGIVLYMVVCAHTRLRLSAKGVALHFLPTSVKQKLGLHGCRPVAHCGSRSPWVWRMCGKAYHGPRQLVMRLNGAMPRHPVRVRDESKGASPSMLKGKRETANSAVLARFPKSGSVPARLGDCTALPIATTAQTEAAVQSLMPASVDRYL